MQISVRTTDNTSQLLPRQQHLIGDFPFDNCRPTWIMPDQPPYYVDPYQRPYIQPQVGQFTLLPSFYTPIRSCSWRVKEDGLTVQLALDVPGVKLADLSLEFEDGVLTAATKRFDTKDSYTETYDLGTLYDPETIGAVLECGVLTVTAKKFPNFSARKITVKKK